MNDFNSKRTWGPKPNYPIVLKVEPKLKDLFVVSGPCSVESEAQIEAVVPELAKNRVNLARGGVYRAGTYPGPVFGLQRDLANLWAEKCHKAGLRVVMEVLDIRQVEEMALISDAFQAGARHMQDYALLKELAKYSRPVLLKRSVGSTLDEFLGAAEYLCQGKCTPLLIERGTATHMNHVRWDLSISLIAAVKKLTGIPILVDASHGTGRRDIVRDMTLAGIAAGADGFLLETHPDPENSLSDADQAYPLSGLGEVIGAAKRVRDAAKVQ